MATPIPAKAVLEFTPRPRTLPALPGRAWSADRLAEVVAATDDLSIRRRAVELGEVIRREDGETAAAKFTEEAVTERVPRSVLSENVSH